jgi:phospholipid transport system substrate-binding protein
MLRRSVLAALLGIAVAIAAPGLQSRAESNTERAEVFVRSLAEKAIDTLTGKKLTQVEREDRFREILRDYFDLNAIGKWVLGRHWRVASGPERDEYMSLFEDLIVKTYATRFREYSTERLAVSNATTQTAHDAIVHSELIRPHGAPPIRIDWRVRAPHGELKVVDVVVEGVSMTQTQRSEFGSVIRRHGGDVGGLIAALRDITGKAEAAKVSR